MHLEAMYVGNLGDACNIECSCCSYRLECITNCWLQLRDIGVAVRKVSHGVTGP